jgi:hypothetical protein
MANQKRIKDIWKRKDDYIASRLDWLSKRVGKAQSEFMEMLIAEYVGRFDTDDKGNIKRTAKNIRLALGAR